MSNTLFSLAFGLGTHNQQEQWLEVFYAQPVLNPTTELMAKVKKVLGYSGGNQVIRFDCEQASDLAHALRYVDPVQSALLVRLAESHRPTVATILANDSPLTSVPEAYLKLQLISHRLVKPHEVDLTALFSVLPNVAWTNIGAIDLEELPAFQLEERIKDRALEVLSIDKLPRMCDYVVPSGIRIADAARVRLGAYIGEGSTIMHEGFVNFNAGCEGPNMVEGRISAGVMVGKHSDLGGGCSTMGTLSGGGKAIISVGEQCLIGANAGIGISLGARCTVEAGLYITASSKIILIEKDNQIVKGADISGQDDLLLRRNSLTGAIECLTNYQAITLNEQLHKN